MADGKFLMVGQAWDLEHWVEKKSDTGFHKVGASRGSVVSQVMKLTGTGPRADGLPGSCTGSLPPSSLLELIFVILNK